MQLSLFDEQHVGREAFREALKRFDMVAAEKALKMWERTFSAPEDLENKKEAIRFINQQLKENGQTAIPVLAMWRQKFSEISQFTALKEERKFLLEGINRFLQSKLGENHFDFIFEDLHPAEVHFYAGAYQQAMQSAERYLQKFGEQPLMRQLRAAALSKLNRNREAEIEYSLAMFNDPRGLGEDFFLLKAHRKKLEYLQMKFESPAEALLHLPFALWEQGDVRLDENEREFERFLQKRIEEEQKDVPEILKFTRRLYLAEVERLRLPRKETSDWLESLREQMKTIHSDWFLRYLERLRSFQLI